MTSAHDDLLSPDRTQTLPRKKKARISLAFVATGVILLMLAVLMFVYVVSYKPGLEKQEFEGRIEHPSTKPAVSASPGMQSLPPGGFNESQRHHPTYQTKLQHISEDPTSTGRTHHRQPQIAYYPGINPLTTGSSIPEAVSFQVVKSPLQEPSASPTPTSSVTRCVAPKTVIPPKKESFFKRVWNVIKKIFGGGRAESLRNARARECSPNQAPTVTLSARKPSIALACPEGFITRCDSPSDQVVALTAIASDPDGDTLLYTYSVTGGLVTGEGANVSWDLSGAQPGTYTATVEVDDGCGCVTFSSTTVTIERCTGCVPPCPTLSVNCPTELVQVGQPVNFSANVTGGDPNASIFYNWTVSAGTITSGQGTPSISVDTTGLASGGSVAATVELGGVSPECNRTASCTTELRVLPSLRKFEEYGNIAFNDEKARLDRFAIELQNNPGAQGFIFAYGSCEGEASTRAGRARDYLVNARGIDAGSINVIDGGCRKELAVELWVVPAGASMLTPDSQGEAVPCAVCSNKPPRAATASLAGVVIGPNGETIAGAKVVVYREDGLSKEVTTDQGGNFAFKDLDAGTYRLEIDAEGFGKLVVKNVVVKDGENFLPPLNVDREARTTAFREQDVIRVEYPDRFLKDTLGEVAFVFDRRLTLTEVETSETKGNGKIEIQEKAPPVPGATPNQPYGDAYGGLYHAFAKVDLVRSGLTIVQGPSKTEQSLKEAPVTWNWKLKLADANAKVVSFRFHVDLIWRAPGLPDRSYSYDWERTFSVPVGPPTAVVVATYGYQGFGAGGLGMIGIGAVRRRKKKKGDPESDEVSEEVSTSVYAPREAVAGDSFFVQVFAHLPEEDPDVLRTNAMAADPNAQRVGTETLDEPIRRGATLSFTLTMDGLTIDKSTQTRIWKGRTIRVQFGVTVPQHTRPRGMTGMVVVCHDGEPVGHFGFAFKILASATEKTDQPVPIEPVTRYENSFISYAHEDRAEVLKRVQLLSVMRRKYFLDMLNIKSGDEWESRIYDYIDKSDCFILFWSSAAQGSVWVKKEISRALARQGGNREAPPKIYAVPLEGPPPPPPPDELSYLHFDDELNYLIFAAERTSEH